MDSTTTAIARIAEQTATAFTVRVDADGTVSVDLDPSLVARYRAALERVRELGSITVDSLPEADTARREVVACKKAIEQARVGSKAPWLTIERTIDNAARDPLGDLGDAEALLTRAMGDVQREVERDRKRAEQARLEAERRARERDEAIAKLAETAAPADAPALAELRREARDEGARDYVGSVLATPTAPVRTSVHLRKVPTVVISDADAVPIKVNGVELRPIDHKAVKRVIDGGTPVPGAYVEDREVPRGGR